MIPTPEQMLDAIYLASMDELFFVEREGTIYPCILVNDMFYYATSDAEEVDWSEVPKLAKLYREGNWPSIVKYVEERRNMKALPAVQQGMVYVGKLREALNKIVSLKKESVEYDPESAADGGNFDDAYASGYKCGESDGINHCVSIAEEALK